MACDSAPEVYWGQTVPTWEGSFSATVTLFQNIQIFALVDYLGGRVLSSGDLLFSHFFADASRAILERTDPILLGYESLIASDGFQEQVGIIDGGFAKLRDVSINYHLPRTLTSWFGASQASATLSARNLATLWVAQRGTFGHPQTDPEVASYFGGTGISPYHQEGWPTLRSFTFTLRVTF